MGQTLTCERRRCAVYGYHSHVYQFGRPCNPVSSPSLGVDIRSDRQSSVPGPGSSAFSDRTSPRLCGQLTLSPPLSASHTPPCPSRCTTCALRAARASSGSSRSSGSSTTLPCTISEAPSGRSCRRLPRWVWRPEGAGVVFELTPGARPDVQREESDRVGPHHPAPACRPSLLRCPVPAHRRRHVLVLLLRRLAHALRPAERVHQDWPQADLPRQVDRRGGAEGRRRHGRMGPAVGCEEHEAGIRAGRKVSRGARVVLRHRQTGSW